MHFFITGGGGFIGGYLARAFARAGHAISLSYHRTKPAIEAELAERITCHPVALGGDPIALRVAPIDCIIHCAACHPSSPERPTAEAYISANVSGALQLRTFALAHRVPLLINLSTISVYGQVQQANLTEDHPLVHPTMYGMTKYLAEEIFRERAELSTLNIRLPGVVGPGSFGPWLGSVTRAALQDRDITIYGPTAPFNNVVDTEMLYDFLQAALKAGISGHQIVLLAATSPIPVREVLSIVTEGTGSRSRVIEAEQPLKAPFFIDTSKVRQLYHYNPAPTRMVVERYVAAVRTLRGTV